MSGHELNASYKIWAVDNVVYGPVDLATLTFWIKEDRVTASTWIYLEQQDAWQKAAELTEIRSLFPHPSADPGEPSKSAFDSPSLVTLKAGALRRLKIFGNFEDQQLERFKKYLVLQPISQFSSVVKQGDPGDAMYFVFEGELRVRMLIGGKESTIATLPVGDFFGEFCLFDHGPRSADVIANQDSVLLKMSAAAFQQLVSVEPELASPFLTAICKTLAARIRADNKRYRDSISFARARE